MDELVSGSNPHKWAPAEERLKADRAALLAGQSIKRMDADHGIPADLLERGFRPDEGGRIINGRILLDAGSSGPQGWSTRSRVLRCPMAYGLALKGFQSNSPPLVKGSLIHVGTAHYYARLQARQQGWTGTAEDATPGPEAYLTPMEAIEELAMSCGPQWYRWARLAKDCVGRYIVWHKPFHEHVVAVEHLVIMDVPWTTRTGEKILIPHTARIDLITQLNDGRYRIVDHKSTSTAFRRTTPYDLSGQINGLNWWGSRIYGEHYAGLELNVMRLPSVGKGGKIGDWPKVPFERMNPALAPHAVRNFPKTVAWSVYQHAMLRREFGDDPTLWPMALSDSGPCMDTWGPCDFREFCKWGSQEGLVTK
jgi:hypothetical protein